MTASGLSTGDRSGGAVGRLMVAWAATFAVGAASGADLVVLDNDKSASQLACLQPAGNALPPLPYPTDALLLKRDATVRVRMTFTKPDAAPAFDRDFRKLLGRSHFTLLDPGPRREALRPRRQHRRTSFQPQETSS